MSDLDAEIKAAQTQRGTGFAELQDEDGVYTKDKFAGFEGSIAAGEMEEDDGMDAPVKRSTFTAPTHLLDVPVQASMLHSELPRVSAQQSLHSFCQSMALTALCTRHPCVHARAASGRLPVEKNSGEMLLAAVPGVCCRSRHPSPPDAPQRFFLSHPCVQPLHSSLLCCCCRVPSPHAPGYHTLSPIPGARCRCGGSRLFFHWNGLHRPTAAAASLSRVFL